MLFILAMPASSAYAYYYVSGVVDFSYTSYTTKIGEKKTTDTSWTEHYGVTLGTAVIDPRFLQLTAGVSYQKSHLYKTPDQDIMSYSINASFFPGRMIAWTLFGAKSILNVPSTYNLAGYDVESSSYGGTMYLKLSLLRRKSGNNNFYNNNRNYNNNNNNNNRRGASFALPDLTLSATHADVQSMNVNFPLHEARDNVSALMLYQITPSINLNVDGRREEYQNLLNNSTYTFTTLDMVSNVHLARSGELRLTGRTTERAYDNIGGSTGTISTYLVGAQLDLQPKKSISQSYRTNYGRVESMGAEIISKDARAQIQYAMLRELSFKSAISYGETDYRRDATAATPATHSNIKTGALSVGAHYLKEFKPEMLDPFIVRAGYDFDTGFTDITYESGQQSKGKFYQNQASLGLLSSGWRFETLELGYSYVSRRDNSLMNQNLLSENYWLSMSTRRIPRSRLNASVKYSLSTTNTGPSPDPFVSQQPETNRDARFLQYNANFEHDISSNLSFISGASRAKTNSNSAYTLATVPLYGASDVTSERYFASLNGNYPLGRALQLRCQASEEWSNTEPNGSRLQSHLLSAGIDWRLRKIFINADYRWRQDMREASPTIQQQYFFVKAVRPF